MMHFFFTFARIYPAWAVPTAFIFFELGIYYRRKASKLQYYLWGITAIQILLLLVWLIFRGDINSDLWVRAVVDAFT
jgi:hypothetical protein